MKPDIAFLCLVLMYEQYVGQLCVNNTLTCICSATEMSSLKCLDNTTGPLCVDIIRHKLIFQLVNTNITVENLGPYIDFSSTVEILEIEKDFIISIKVGKIIIL